MFKKYLAAISGGSDSIALLNKYKKFIKVVCHVNYHNREDTNNDQMIVENYCLQNKIKCEVLNVTEKENHVNFSNNDQTNARKIRFDFFLKIAKENKINKILIAHNFNDHIETAYDQIKKNKKPLYYGIPKFSKYQNLTIIRPFIKKTKLKIYDYCLNKKLDFCFDYTNELDIYQRNKNRKILNEMSKKNFINLVNEINYLNNSKKSFRKKIIKLYSSWEKSNFLLSFFFDQKDNKKQINLIYLYLSNFGIQKINTNKLLAIIDFINSSSINAKYRVLENVFILKKDSCLQLLFS